MSTQKGLLQTLSRSILTKAASNQLPSDGGHTVEEHMNDDVSEIKMVDPSGMNTDSMLLLQTQNNLNFTDDQLHSFDNTKNLTQHLLQLREQDSVDNLVIDRDEEVKSDKRFPRDLIDIQFNNFTP